MKEKIDLRKVSNETLEMMRERCIKWREAGKSNEEISELLGVTPQTTSRWWQNYLRDGDATLKTKARGRPKGSNKVFTPQQEQQIIRMLVTQNPKQLQFDFALWTRESVKALIDRQFIMDIPLSTVGYYLKRWQFSAKKPIKRAYERKDAATKRWLEAEYPKIKEAARKEHAAIWWADETACVSLPNNLKGYAPIGTHHKPVLEHTAKKFKINMISAVTNTGKTMFALYDENINVERFIDFLEKVIEASDQKVYLIVDNLRVHHAKLVKAWEKEHEDQIALYYLPPYSPEYNPDEYLNQDFKRNANKKLIPKTKKELEQNTRAYMDALCSNPEKVANFFKHPSVAYAAC